jgi:hypothetical protein
MRITGAPMGALVDGAAGGFKGRWLWLLPAPAGVIVLDDPVVEGVLAQAEAEAG